MALYKQYMKEISEKLGFLTLWLPSDQWQLGDVISFDKDIRHETSLLELGIPFTQRSSRSEDVLNYTSDGAIRFTPQAQVGVTGVAKGAAMLDFGRAHAIALAFNGITTHYITNTAALGTAVMKLYEAGKWQRNWHVITELVSAKQVAILIASEGNTSIAVQGAVKGITDMLMQIGAGADYTIASGSVASFANSRAAVFPLFKTSCIKSRLLLSPIFQGGGRLMRLETFSNSGLEWKESFEEATFDDIDFLE